MQSGQNCRNQAAKRRHLLAQGVSPGWSVRLTGVPEGRHEFSRTLFRAAEVTSNRYGLQPWLWPLSSLPASSPANWSDSRKSLILGFIGCESGEPPSSAPPPSQVRTSQTFLLTPCDPSVAIEQAQRRRGADHTFHPNSLENGVPCSIVKTPSSGGLASRLVL